MNIQINDDRSVTVVRGDGSKVTVRENGAACSAPEQEMKIKNINIRKSSSHIVGVRHFSITNTWIDFVVLVYEGFLDDVQKIVRESMEEYWLNDDLCYGDIVENKLNHAGIPYLVFYHNANDESEEYEEEWEAFINSLPCKVTATT